jgi:deoxycytidylate deaminase
MTIQDALSRASQEARKSAETFRLGAALLKGRAVVATGRNRNVNSCGLHSIHAEMDALWKAAPRGLQTTPKGLHLVVVRVLRDDHTTACSRPCQGCQRVLERRGVARVTYTTGNPVQPLQTMIL